MKKDGTIKWKNDEKGWNDQWMNDEKGWNDRIMNNDEKGWNDRLMNKWCKRMERSINESMM